MDDHALDKMIRLLGERYDKGTNMVTLEVNSAPVKQQNLEYAKYLLTALYYESWVSVVYYIRSISKFMVPSNNTLSPAPTT